MSINAVYEDSQGNVHESRMDGVDLTTKISIADDFSINVNYDKGEYCYHLGTLYKCTTAHTAGAWNAAHFTATQVGDEISELKNTLSDCFVRKYYSETTNANGNVAILNTLESYRYCIVAVSCKGSQSPNDAYIAVPFVYGSPYSYAGMVGISVTDIVGNKVASTAIEGYLWMIDMNKLPAKII